MAQVEMARPDQKRHKKTGKKGRRGNGERDLEAVCWRGKVPPWVPRATACPLDVSDRRGTMAARACRLRLKQFCSSQ
ncbi:hypothetical protein J6590_067405 [Homalodisca vitripennis]|nr:hypothetical protein J6590_067405 [Homalodisca vitripennis]